MLTDAESKRVGQGAAGSRQLWNNRASHIDNGHGSLAWSLGDVTCAFPKTHINVPCSAPTGGLFLMTQVAPGWQSCYVAITNSHLEGNEATSAQPGASFAELQGSGGAIWTNAPFLWIHNSSLTGNTAATVGGAVFYQTSVLQVCMHARGLRAALQGSAMLYDLQGNSACCCQAALPMPQGIALLPVVTC